MLKMPFLRNLKGKKRHFALEIPVRNPIQETVNRHLTVAALVLSDFYPIQPGNDSAEGSLTE
jgi:hypothetical protein